MKNRWKGLLCALLITIVTCSTLLLPSTAKAWKTKTHGYSANLLLKDAEDGKLTVDGVEYTMPDEYKTALQKYPQSFRAGVLGPDFYPDMLTGQSYIHPYDPDSGTGVGDWLKLLVEGVNNMTPDSDDRYNALAFTLGMAVHYAGDMFGHDFINAFAGGAYPAYADAVHDQEKLFYIIRHMAEETKMDSLIGNRLGQTGVDAPDKFILSKWIYNGSPNGGPATIYEKYGGMMYQYTYLVEVRGKLFDFTQEYRDSTILTPLVDYVGKWVEDLDIATEELVHTFDLIAHDFLTKPDGDHAPSDVSIVKTHLQNWLNNYGMKATPLPDFLVELGNLLRDLKNKFMQATGLDRITKGMDEFIDDLMEDAIYGIFNAMGFDYERYANYTKDPQYCLSDQDYNEYMTFMNLFSSNAEAFDAFFNTLVMGKLILMGPDSLKSFFSKYGVSTSFGHTDARVMMDSFDLSIHTKKNSGGSTYGTDDNVILKVYNGNELLLKTVLDNPNENVFENGNYDVFKIGLQKRIYPENLRLELSTDRKYHDEWTLDTVAVRCYSAGSTLYLMSSSLPKAFQYNIALHSGDVLFDEESDVLALTMPVNSMPISRRQYDTALNLSIIDFLWSCDNSSQWVNEDNILWKNTDARKKILYEVFHGFKPKISLSVDHDTFISGDDVKLTVNLASYWNGITKERRDLEYTISSLNEVKQEACAGPVEVLVQNEQGQPVSTLYGSAGNGVAKISLSGLNPGKYKLVAKYDGDNYNGKAESGPITVNVVEPGNKYKVTYTIQNGTWADGSTDPKTEYVEPGGYPANVPTGMKPGSPGNTSGYWYETDPATTVINKNTEFTYNYMLSYVKIYNLTYKIVNGTWSDGSTEPKHYTVVKDTVVDLWSWLGIPNNMKPFRGYGDGSWDNYPTTSLVQNGTKIFTYTFQTLPKFDVTYKVVNGTWANGSTAEIHESVMKGYTPSVIPYGMKAAQGFRNGTWDKDPAMTAVTENTTFIYTFTTIPKHTVTYRIVNGTWANGDTDDITETVVDGCYPASVPVGMLPLSDRFTEGSWDINPVDEPVLSPVTYTFTYKPIRTVTYKVVNGTWADGTTDDLTEDVIDGKTPTGFPSGMIASHGYSSGRWDTDPEGTVINGNRTFTWTFSPLPKYTVTYKIVNGTWADSTAADITESVIEGDSPAGIPAGMIASHGYKFGGWDIDPEGMVITGNKTFTWTFSALPQYTVTYKVVNGTWADGTAGDVRESVIEGDSPANIPAGMIPAHGFASGNWDHDPTGEAITANRTFTWTFSALPKYTVTYKIVNGTWADGTSGNITESVIEGDFPAKIPTGMVPAQGFKFGGWDIDPEGTAITGNLTFTWTFSALPQYTVTYKIINGTWADGTAGDITESVIEGQYPANIPTGMIADDGFTTGAWDRNPAGSPVTKAETFTWTFVKGSAAYTITCDQNTWLKGSTVGLSFVVHRSVRDDLTFSKFSTLLLNGNPLDARDFNVSAGSLYVTVKPSKLNTLDPGSYRIKVLFTDGEAELVFSVNEGKAVPKTGDSADLMLWTGMLLAGLAVLSTVVVRCRRRKNHR